MPLRIKATSSDKLLKLEILEQPYRRYEFYGHENRFFASNRFSLHSVSYFANGGLNILYLHGEEDDIEEVEIRFSSNDERNSYLNDLKVAVREYNESIIHE